MGCPGKPFNLEDAEGIKIKEKGKLVLKWSVAQLQIIWVAEKILDPEIGLRCSKSTSVPR